MKKLGKRQIKKIKDVLIEEKDRVLRKIELLKIDKKLSEKSPDEVDEANADFENSRSLRLRNRDIFYLKKINMALTKINENELGNCDECDCVIRFERLMARPTANLCIYCKEEMEKEESSNIHQRRSQSLGQTINFVSSY